MAPLRRREVIYWPLSRCYLSTLYKSCSGTPSSCRWAALALILATPRFLADAPSSHPIGIPRNAVVRLGYLTGASLAMSFATPHLFSHRPTLLPIGVSIGTIVRVCRPDWCNRSDWHHWCNWSNWHHWCNRSDWHYWWRLGNHHLWATQMVDLAAPSFFACAPLRHGIHCAIIGVSSRHRACWAWNRPWDWPGRWRWCCGRCCGCSLGESCS